MPNIKKIRRTVNRNRLKITLCAAAIAAVIYFLFIKGPSDQTLVINKSDPSNSPSPAASPTPNPNIQNLLQSQIQALPGNYNVVIKDLKTNETYSTRKDQKIPTASIYKLAVMYKTFDALEKNRLKKDEILSGDISVSKALERMITVSDNESALLLAENLGWSNINKFLEDEGIIGFNLMVKDYPTTTAAAVSDLLERIYRKTAVSKNASEEMLKLLLAQERNDRIPLNLPLNINVAHKTGELDNFRHDAGIVFGTKGDYIFVFLTETPDPAITVSNIAKISKIMFEALEKY